MKRSNYILLIAIGLPIVAIAIYLLLNVEEHYNWNQNFRAEGEEPYDLDVFYELLKENTQNADFTELSRKLDVELVELDANKTYNLFIIRRNFNPDTIELKALENFVKKGNTVLLSAQTITPLLPISLAYGTDSVISLYNKVISDEMYSELPDSIYEKYDSVNSYEEKDSIFEQYKEALENKVWANDFLDSADFGKTTTLKSLANEQKVDLAYVLRNDTAAQIWKSVKLPEVATGKNYATFENKKTAFLQWKVGNGQIFISSTPLLFSNYYMIKKEHFLFTNSLLANMPSGDILVDHVKRYNNDVFSPKANLGQSPLNFILSQKALKWAWFTLLATALIFVIFRSKRKQRIIPIVKPNNNTTLAYAKMLGSLQLKEKNNTAKSREILRHFFQGLRNKNRWHSNEINEGLKITLQKLAPEHDREIQIVLHLGTKAMKNQVMNDQEVVTFFNYSKRILERI